MGCLGVHFALTEDQAAPIWAAYEKGDDVSVMNAVEVIEEAWDEEHLYQTDKAWDAIHRVLSDGTLRHDAGAWPLKGAVLGGECMYFEEDYPQRSPQNRPLVIG